MPMGSVMPCACVRSDVPMGSVINVLCPWEV